MTAPVLSVVIPAYNEGHHLPATLDEILSYLASCRFSAEIILVDDGSHDGTSEMAQVYVDKEKRAQVRLVRNGQNRGKGYSVRRGVLESHGSYALLTDADLSVPIREMPVLEREVMGGGCHIAIGSRDVEGSSIEIRQPRVRERSGKIFNLLTRLLTGLPYRDTQCGFKLFEMSRCRELFSKQTIEGFAFDVEVLYVARKWGLFVKEVPVLWRDSADTKVRLLLDAPRMILDLFRIRWNERKGLYDC